MAAIRRSRGLCTIDDVKRRLPNYIEPTDSDEAARADALIFDLIDSASDLFYEASGREFLSLLDPGDTSDSGGSVWPLPPSETRTFGEYLNPLVGGSRAAAFRVGDMQAVTALAVGADFSTSSTALDLTTYVVQLPRPRAAGKPIRSLIVRGGVYDGQVFTVTGRWGWPKMPQGARQAVARQAAIWASEDLANFTRSFIEAAAGGAAPREPRMLSQAVYDTALLYQIPSLG